MQIVYISNRKNLSEETLKYVENLMPFIHEAVYICPGVQMNEFKFNSSLKITVIDESNALGKRNQLFRESKDHQFRNWLLRSSLSHLEFIDDEFIMSDDDSRPLKEIPMEFFKRANISLKDTITVLITAYRDKDISSEASEIGIHDFIEKPFLLGTLFESLARLIKSQKEAYPSIE